MKKDKKIFEGAKPMKLFYLFLLILFLFYIRYFYLATAKTIDGINMKEFAMNRNTVSKILYANRGTIYDSSDNILAVNMSSYTVIAYLSSSRGNDYVKDKEATASLLAPILNMKEEDLIKLFNKNLYQVELGTGGRGISEVTKEEITNLNLPGIDFVEGYKRYYRNSDFASYILGYAKNYDDVDENNNATTRIVGELGIEKYFNDILKGSNGYYKYQRDRFGYKIPDTPEEKVESINGKDIYLTIDSQIQRFVEKGIDNIEKNMSVEWTIMAILDAKTGAILGFSTSPSFDPNKKNVTNYEDPLIGRIYEPGSVMKIYTYMCAIESGKYNGANTFKSGSLSMGTDSKGKELVIRDWNRIGWGTITYDEGFARSSNVGVSYLTQDVITKAELRDCLEKYGFDKTTGIYDGVIKEVSGKDTKYEKKGTIDFNYPIEVASAAFGQGISTNVVQQLQGLTIISNNGKMLKPYIIDKIVDTNTNKTIYQNKISESDRVISDSTVSKIKDLMYSVVNGPTGTGSYYRIDGYDIIGKTGTAQVYNNKTNSYSSTIYISSFAGMFPKDDPEIIIYTATKTSSTYTSPIFASVKDVIKNVSKTLNIYGTNSSSTLNKKITLDNYINASTESIKSNLEKNGIKVITIGNGDRIINQYPYKGVTVISNDKVFLVTNNKHVIVPNMIGWSRIDVINYCNLANISYEIEGTGFVVNQSIKEGTAVLKEDKLVVTLNDKITKEDS